MKNFISQNIENGRLELLIDTKLFTESISMKAAYSLLDKAYFLFHGGENDSLIVQISPKEGQNWDAQKFALEYADELLGYALRVHIETENKIVRETIVRRALGSYADLPNFTSVDPVANNSQIDFDKDIDEILKEIENDPELKIDEDEINRILAEIEAETKESQKPKLDLNKLKDVKKNFQNK